MRVLLQIIILYFTTTAFGSNVNDIYFYHLGLQDGLSQINVMSIYQDEFGTIWFGTTEGLNRYNGRSIETFHATNNILEIVQNTIHAIEGNKNGSMYILAGSDLVKYDLIEQEFKVLQINNVRAIQYQDGALWVVSGLDILKYNDETDRFVKYAEANKRIGTIKALSWIDSKLWIGGTKGLEIISDTGREFLLPGIYVSYLFQDSEQNCYVGTFYDGIYLFDKQRNMTNHRHIPDQNSLSNNQVRTITEGTDGEIWVGTFFGLNQYNPKENTWKKYLSNDNITYALSHNSIFALLKDMQGTIWVGTYFGGVSYFNTEIGKFKYYGASSTNENFLSFPFISSMVQDKHENLWICTEGGALNCLNLNSGKISRYIYKENDLEAIDYNNYKCIWYHKEKDVLYIGTHNGGLVIFDVKTKTSRRILANSNMASSLPSNVINKMQYYNGDLLLLTQGGLVRMDLENEVFYPFSDNPQINNFLRNGISASILLIDSKNRMWVEHRSDMHYINLNTDKIQIVKRGDSETSDFKSAITDIFESSLGEMYIATAGQGLLKYNASDNEMESYLTEEHGLKSNYTYCISELPSGNLILLHNKGISFLDTKDENKTIITTGSKFPLIGFNYGSSVYTTVDKEVFVGGVNGLVSFFENNIKEANYKYNLYFDKLFINHEIAEPGDRRNILQKSLAYTKHITLDDDENNIIVEFASSNYLNTVRNYEYMLEGYDDDWIYTNIPTITYTNLNPGSYTLFVREETDGDQESRIYSLAIMVKPPFYKTSFAFIIYFILILLITYAIMRFYSWRFKVETTLKYEQKEKERIEELNQNKLSFFTNVSHEFRTPLTLIIGQVELLLAQDDLTNKIKNKALKIQKNAAHLLLLITELLDFRKFEQGYNALNMTSVDLIPYLGQIAESFYDYATKKNIKFTIQVEENELYAHIDTTQFQKVIYNLLSNAFKYTSNGGTICMTVAKDNEYIYIKIKDTGIGIPAEALSQIFDKFYQIENRASGFTLGTGIGLALAREIVFAHKGEIKVESEPNAGSTFTIILPLESEYLLENETNDVDINEMNQAYSSTLEVMDIHSAETKEISTIFPESIAEAQTILLVEDNEEILKMLTEVFSKEYMVYTAVNGKIAWEMISKYQPDLVLSDVMMPEMTGKELCEKIKNNVYTSHIPVILLTAQDSVEQIIDGLMYNADAYITKPFNVGILMSQCENLLNNRKILYDRFKNNDSGNYITNSDGTTKDYDSELIAKAIEVISENFGNPDFDMNTLGEALAMGRTKLFSTIKKVTGLTPNEFTLNLKMKEAIRCLDNCLQMNISDIAVHLGFSSTKYFSKCFKSFYGLAPQDWRKRNKE